MGKREKDVLEFLFQAPADATRVSLPKPVETPGGVLPAPSDVQIPESKISPTGGPSVLRESLSDLFHLLPNYIKKPAAGIYGTMHPTSKAIVEKGTDFISGELEYGTGIGDLGSVAAKAGGVFLSALKSGKGPKNLDELKKVTGLNWEPFSSTQPPYNNKFIKAHEGDNYFYMSQGLKDQVYISISNSKDGSFIDETVNSMEEAVKFVNKNTKFSYPPLSMFDIKLPKMLNQITETPWELHSAGTKVPYIKTEKNGHKIYIEQFYDEITTIIGSDIPGAKHLLEKKYSSIDDAVANLSNDMSVIYKVHKVSPLQKHKDKLKDPEALQDIMDMTGLVWSPSVGGSIVDNTAHYQIIPSKTGFSVAFNASGPSTTLKDYDNIYDAIKDIYADATKSQITTSKSIIAGGKLGPTTKKFKKLIDDEDVLDYIDTKTGMDWTPYSDNSVKLFTTQGSIQLIKRHNNSYTLVADVYGKKAFNDYAKLDDALIDANSIVINNSLEPILNKQTAIYQPQKVGVASVDFEIDPRTFLNKRVGPQEGSNPGGWFEVDTNSGWQGLPVGSKVYAKFYDDPTQARGEVLSNYIYSRWGRGRAPDSYLFENEGKIGFASREINNPKAIHSVDDITPNQAKEFLEDAALDILTGNWDVIGLNWDNIVQGADGFIYRIDQGGSLLSRAQGARKPASVLEKITEFDRFPSESAYSQMLRKAGHKDFYDLAPSIIERINKMPDFWNNIVRDMFPNWYDDDTKAVISMLNSRSRLLKDKIPEIRNIYFERKITETIANRGTDFIDSSWPMWQKILKADLDKESMEFFRRSVGGGHIEDFEDVGNVLGSWFSSSSDIKSAFSHILGWNVDVYGKNLDLYHDYVRGISKDKFIEASTEILRAIGRETETAPLLYRGHYINSIEWEKIGIKNWKPGDLVELLPSSFSESAGTARGFMGGIHNILFELEPNSKALRGSNLSGHNEFEWITGGFFRVIDRSYDRGRDLHHIQLRMEGVFDVPEKK